MNPNVIRAGLLVANAVAAGVNLDDRDWLFILNVLAVGVMLGALIYGWDD